MPILIIFLVLLLAAAVLIISRKWALPLRGYVQLTALTTSEIFLICDKSGVACSTCPLSFGVCPMGTVQRLAFIRTFPVPLTITIFILTGLVLGTLTCGWLCPVGFVQDLFSSASPVRPRNKIRMSVLRIRKIVFAVVALLVAGEFLTRTLGRAHIDVFNELTIYGGTAVLFAAFFFWRPFCRALCPLGWVYGHLNRFSPVRVILNGCTDCGACRTACVAGLRPDHEVNGLWCVKCFQCSTSCVRNEHVRP